MKPANPGITRREFSFRSAVLAVGTQIHGIVEAFSPSALSLPADCSISGLAMKGILELQRTLSWLSHPKEGLLGIENPNERVFGLVNHLSRLNWIGRPGYRTASLEGPDQASKKATKTTPLEYLKAALKQNLESKAQPNLLGLQNSARTFLLRAPNLRKQIGCSQAANRLVCKWIEMLEKADFEGIEKCPNRVALHQYLNYLQGNLKLDEIAVKSLRKEIEDIGLDPSAVEANFDPHYLERATEFMEDLLKIDFQLVDRRSCQPLADELILKLRTTLNSEVFSDFDRTASFRKANDSTRARAVILQKFPDFEERIKAAREIITLHNADKAWAKEWYGALLMPELIF